MITDQAHDLGAFRTAVHDWLVANVPAGWQQQLAGASSDEVVAFQRDWMIKLGSAGLATAHWPKEYGGAGLGLQHQIIIADESAKTNAPPYGVYIVALNHIPATLIPSARGAETKISARHPKARSGARVSRSRAPAPTSPRCAARQRTRATTI